MEIRLQVNENVLTRGRFHLPRQRGAWATNWPGPTAGQRGTDVVFFLPLALFLGLAEAEQGREATMGPAGSSGLRPNRTHRRAREDAAPPFRGETAPGEARGGGEAAATEADREAAVVMISGDAGRSGEG